MGSYVYRRELTRDEAMPALGIGLGVGLGVALLTAYLTRIFLSRTPLEHVGPASLRHSRERGNPGHGEQDLDSRLRRNDGRPGHGARAGQDRSGRP